MKPAFSGDGKRFVTVALPMAKYWNNGYMQWEFAYALDSTGK